MPDPTAVEKHLENIRKFNVPPVVAINRLITDQDDEIRLIKDFADNKNLRLTGPGRERSMVPGLPVNPVAETVDIDETGRITGLF
ncbi:MAG TPA: formate--tetrahydrofolate ligase [bacterium (Candidatus Stahlbacteria)]|nr:formate--tetrahydrofolate ligase [Candidatus Stahlbacteria bacterium]